MMETTKHRSVTFAHPFSLVGVEGTYPPGTYEISDTSEQIEGLSFVAHRRTMTTIELPGTNGALISRQVVEVHPDDLATALARDEAVTTTPGGAS